MVCQSVPTGHRVAGPSSRGVPRRPYEALKTTLYTTSATAKGGRAGHVTSADGVIDLDTGKPGSKSNPKANPETLFAAGYASCFGNAILSVGQRAGLDLSASTCTATVSLGTTDTGVGIAAALAVHIPGVDQATAKQLTAAAHESCPYSKATRGNIEVTITVTTD